MRIGALLTDPDDVADAAAAGLFGILLEPAVGVSAVGIPAAEVAALTVDARVLVRVVLGEDNPVTLAEEVAVLDHLSAGRAVAVVDPGELDAAGAAEDLGLLRACWSGRPVRHAGVRWTVPSGVMGLSPAAGLAVTPLPAQIDIPVWLTRPIRGAGEGLPVLATEPASVQPGLQVQPGMTNLTGDLDHDRTAVTAWADAGATHLLVRPPDRADRPAAFFSRHVARYLQPEVSMPAFPRILAEADLPAVLPAAGTPLSRTS